MLAVARVAGIMALKNTGALVPLAHGGVGVEGARVWVEGVGGEGGGGGDTAPPATTTTPATTPEQENKETTNAPPNTNPDAISRAQNLTLPIGSHGGVRISALVETTGKTGVEMEALAGVVGAALTVVDMVKGVDRGCVVEGVRVVGKKGGRRGAWGVWGE